MTCICGRPVFRDNRENLNDSWKCAFPKCGVEICGFCNWKHTRDVHGDEKEIPPPYRVLTWIDIGMRQT